MGWREIRGYTDKAVARIGKAEYERQRQWSEAKETLGEGLSLWQKHQEGKAAQTELEEFGTSEGLTYDKKSKSFYGTATDYESSTDTTTKQHYKISPAELKNMQNFMKSTDKEDIYDFISTKDGNIKKGFQSEGMPVYEKTFMEKMKKNKGMSLGDYGKTAWGMLTQGSKTPTQEYTQPQSKVDTQSNEEKYGSVGNVSYTGKNFGGGGNARSIGRFSDDELYDWEGEIQAEHEFQDTNILRNKAKEDEMKILLAEQTKKRKEFDAKVEADKKFQEEEKIRNERREKELNEFNSEKIKLKEAREENLKKALSKYKTASGIVVNGGRNE